MEPDQPLANSPRAEIVESSVTLPIESEHFAAFISGLLGKPQTIERHYTGQFTLSYDDVINTHHLIEQRIHHQNDASLTQFAVSISYDDNSSVRLNSLESFKLHSEVKPLICTSVTFSWIYLVKFQQKDVPEKQQIDLSFGVRSGLPQTIALDRNSFAIFGRPGGGIFVRISHTERTWGNDIESLIDGHLKKLIEVPKGIKAWISTHSGGVGISVGVLLLLGAVIGAATTTSSFIESNKSLFLQLNIGETKNIEALHQKINYMIDIALNGSWPVFVITLLGYIFLSIVLSISLGIWVEDKADNDPPSFILLSQESIKKKKEYESRIKRDWLMFYTSVAVSIVVGVISNIIFHFLFSSP